jgi:hypothetical protein
VRPVCAGGPHARRAHTGGAGSDGRRGAHPRRRVSRGGHVSPCHAPRHVSPCHAPRHVSPCHAPRHVSPCHAPRHVSPSTPPDTCPPAASVAAASGPRACRRAGRSGDTAVARAPWSVHAPLSASARGAGCATRRPRRTRHCWSSLRPLRASRRRWSVRGRSAHFSSSILMYFLMFRVDKFVAPASPLPLVHGGCLYHLFLALPASLVDSIRRTSEDAVCPISTGCGTQRVRSVRDAGRSVFSQYGFAAARRSAGAPENLARCREQSEG